MKKISILLLLAVISLTACDDIESQLQGTWAIDKVYVNNNPVAWDFLCNALGLEKDKSCFLPVKNITDIHTMKETGTWKVFKKNNNKYLQITTTNEFFNRTFEITDLTKRQDTISFGYLLKMTLVSNNLKLDCTKAID